MNELYWISVIGKLHIAFGVSIGISLLFLALVILGGGEMQMKTLRSRAYHISANFP